MVRFFIHNNPTSSRPPRFILQLSLCVALVFPFLSAPALANGNTTPTFLDVPTEIIDIADYDFNLVPLLHVNEPDPDQTLFWSVDVAPQHGNITLTMPALETSGNDITPAGSMSYCANLGYTGTDTFTMRISDGMAFTTRTFMVTVYDETHVWDGTRATSFAGGSGTAEDPFLIATGDQLAYLSDYASALVAHGEMSSGLHFSLIADLDLNHHEWLPIGVRPVVYTYPFRGTIHGNGHTIQNLTIGSALTPRNDLSFTGLIGYATDTHIDNVHLVDVAIYNGLDGSYSGGFVGYMEANHPGATSTSRLERCSVSGTLSITDQSMGGLLAGAFNGHASECSVAGSVLSSGAAYTGGLFGYLEPLSPVTNCYSTASLINAGGPYSSSGGLAGYGDLPTDTPYMFSNCYATGNVITNGIGSVGLLLGEFTASNPVLDNCFYNSTAHLVSNGTPITAKGLGTGSDTGIAVSFDDMRAMPFCDTLNAATTVVWHNNIPFMPGMLPRNLGLPMLSTVPINLGNHPRVVYDRNGSFNTYVPYDTGSYPLGTSIPLAYNLFGLDKGDDVDFEQWNTKADGSGFDYAEGAAYVVATENILYATWLDLDPLPEITQIDFPAAGTYKALQELDFYITFDQPVRLTGSIHLYLNIGYGEFPITLLDGNETNTLRFRYTVAGGDISLGSVQLGDLELAPGSTLTDFSGNAADLTKHNVIFQNVIIDAVTPQLTSVTLLGSAPQQYVGGDYMQVELRYDEPVFTAEDTYYLEVALADSTPIHLFYKSGSGSNTLLFEARIEMESQHSNGITLSNYIFLNQPIVDAAGNVASDTIPGFLIPDLSAVILDTHAPFVVSVILPADTTYKLGDQFDLWLTFNQTMFVQTSGLLLPHLLLSIDTPSGSSTQIAYYESGSASNILLFRLPVTEELLDTNGIQMNTTLQVFDCPIVSAIAQPTSVALPLVNLSQYTFDTIAPYVVTLVRDDPPGKNLFGIGETLCFQLQLSEPTHLMNWAPGFDGYLHLYANATDYANQTNVMLVPYHSGSGTDKWKFAYTVQPGDSTQRTAIMDTGVFAANMTFYDVHENPFDGTFHHVPLDLSEVTIDGVAPQATQLTVPTPGEYVVGDNLDFIVHFNEVVHTVAKPDGEGDYALALKLYLESGVVYAPFFGYWDTVTGQATLTPKEDVLFRYTLTNADSDSDGIEMRPLLRDLSEPYMYEGTHTLADLAENTMLSALPYVDTSGIKILQPMPSPFATDVWIQENVYAQGQEVDVVVIFDQPVFLTGTLDVSLSVGGKPAVAHYNSGNGTNELHFFYTIEENDSGMIGVIPPLVLGVGGSLVNTTLANAHLEMNTIHIINVTADAVKPSMYAVEVVPNTGRCSEGDSILFKLAYSEPCQINLTGDYPQLNFTLGTQAKTATYDPEHGDGSTGYITFQYVIQAGGTGEVMLPAAVTHNDALIQDFFGNVATMAAWNVVNPDDLSGLVVDAEVPAVDEPVVLPPVVVDTSPDEVLINGEKKPIATRSRFGDQQQLQVDDEEVRDLLEMAAQNILFTLPFEEASEQYASGLNGETVKLMEQRNTILQVNTPAASYTLPVHQLKIDEVAKKLGASDDLKDVLVRIEVANPSADDVLFVRNKLAEKKITLIVQPVEFTITCSFGEKSVEVDQFKGYVERLIPIPAGVDPKEVTTAVVLHKDGSIGHVPTVMVQIEGKYYAKIRSLTNSMYTLVAMHAEFSDVATHWAKEAIGDLANRLIVQGVVAGKFAPEQEVLRGDFVAMLVRALGLEERAAEEAIFFDVKPQDENAGAVATAYAYGLIFGDGSGNVNPYAKLTREQAVVLLSRAVALAGKTAGESAEEEAVLAGFADGRNVAEYAREAMAYYVQEGLIVGRDGVSLAPQAPLTRAEATALLQRTLQHCNLID